MRLFVSEYVCSGAWPEPVLPPSLAREGRAMLLALLSDLSALPDVTLCTTWDARLGVFPFGRGATGSASATRADALPENALAQPVAPDAVACGSPPNVECTQIIYAWDESAVFQRLARNCDATYVIAPELDDRLTRRVQAVLDAGGHNLNASPAPIAACSDKWETHNRLIAAGIPTVPTARFDVDTSPLPFNFPLVLKPRFGAGSQDTFLLQDAEELSRLLSAVSRQKNPTSRIHNPKSMTSEYIAQPYVPGQSLSVAAIFRSDGTVRELWPVGEQRLSTNGSFSYLGGRMPSSLAPPPSAPGPLSSLVSRLSSLFPGLRGYIGFDLIVPDCSTAAPLVVDINPRLTTSYLGYRAIASTHLAERILWPDRDWSPIDWDHTHVEFDADGTLVCSPAGRG